MLDGVSPATVIVSRFFCLIACGLVVRSYKTDISGTVGFQNRAGVVGHFVIAGQSPDNASLVSAPRRPPAAAPVSAHDAVDAAMPASPRAPTSGPAINSPARPPITPPVAAP